MSTNEELVKQIRNGRDDLMEELWTRNIRFVYQIVNRYKGLEEEADLLQEAYLGLYSAVQHFDQDAGSSFLNYASYWIKQRVSRYIKSNGIPEGKTQEILKYRRYISQYEEQFHTKPSEAEICDYMDISVKQLRELQKAENKANMASLDAPTGEDISLGDSVADENDPFESVIEEEYQKELKETLWPMVDALEEKEAAVLHERYEENKELKEIAKDIGAKAPSNVHDIQQRAIRDLNTPKNRKKLGPFMYDDIYNKALKGNGPGSFNRSWTSSTERIAIRLYKEEEK